METLFYWKKTVSLSRAEDWRERAAAIVPAERLALVTKAKGRTARLEAYLDTAEEAAALARRFGGRTGKTDAKEWLAPAVAAPGKPLSFGARLLITGHVEALAGLRAAHPGRQVLCIPAAMAFGTGEHATTAMCLRFLAEASTRLNAAGGWRLLDLGSGSGVLALAARSFGAAQATGFDHDPHAVRTARENAVLNHITRVHFRQVDLLKEIWPQSQPGGWPLVTANLFSELLITLLPKIGSALSAGGRLIASGVLASQTPEVETAFLEQGFRVITKRRRGRWVAYLTRK